MIMTKNKHYHPIIFIDYPIRIIGHTTVACAVGATLYSEGRGGWFPYLLLFLQSFVYPQIALLISMKSDRPKFTEYNFLALDSFFLGCWVSYTNFSAVPSMALIIGITMAHFSMGGFKLAGTGFITLLLGIAIVSVFHGVNFQPVSPLYVSVFTVIVLYVFGCAMGFLTFKRAGELKQAKGQLRVAYHEVESLNKTLKSVSSSLELSSIMHQIYESFSTQFHFDLITLQIADTNKNELNFRIYHGLTSTRREADLYTLHVKLSYQNSLSVKAYTENEAVYVSDIFSLKEYAFIDKSIQEIIDFSSVLYHPLVTQREIIGVVGFYSRKKIVVDEKIIRSLKLHLSTIAVVLRNAILYEDAKKFKTSEQSKIPDDHS